MTLKERASALITERSPDPMDSRTTHFRMPPTGQYLLREELVLRIRGYPDYEQRKAEHDAYREKLSSLAGQLGFVRE